MIDKPYVLPPLKPRPSYHWLEANLLKWRENAAQRRANSKSFFGRMGYGLLGWFFGRELRSGRKIPLPMRIWYFVGGHVLRAFPAKRQTGNSILMRKAFTHGAADSNYYGSYVVANLITAIVLLWLVILALPWGIESAYIGLTYQHNKYTNVAVTSHYPIYTASHTFAVHGIEHLSDGSTEEVYLEIGPSFWFQEYNPEFVFGKISDNSICDFDAYGILRRIPLGFRYLSNDSLYALNPWVVDARCKPPMMGLENK